jgi:ATP-dependent Lon protease
LTHKIVAAARAGRKHVVIPAVQANALADLPADVKGAIEVHPVATAREALALGLVGEGASAS